MSIYRLTLVRSFNTLCLISFILITTPAIIVAQSGLDSRDLSGVQSADISDAQLLNYANRAESEGITMTEAFSMARQRGLPASEAEALRNRLEEMSRESGEDVDRSAAAGLESIETPDTADELPQRMESDVTRRTFGSQIFREERMSFTPSMNVPTPTTYELGAGDELMVNIWGEATNVHRLQVSSEGTVDIDNLGPIYVHGLTIEEASEKIIENLQTLYSGLRPGSSDQTTYARVSLDRLRSIQVTIIGEVNNPGDYTVSSMATVYNALYRSGGPNERGSYRHIRVIRDDAVIAELDLYDFLIDGDQSSNIRLRDQDVIQVNPYMKRVEIRGEVKRNSFFELNDDETMQDLIRYAGYFTDSAYTRQLHLHRNTPSERRIVSVKEGEFENFILYGGDVVFVDEILDRFENRVSISGAVWRSGDFELLDGMTLLDLISEADGLRPDAFLSRGIINRVREDMTMEQVAFDLARVMEKPEEYDVALQREDEIQIQSIHNMREELSVQIDGAVQNGGSYDYREDMTLEDLVLKANGFRESASEARIEISRRIIGEVAPEQRGSRLAETFIFDVTRDLQLQAGDDLFGLQPFDRVFVHHRPDYQVQQTVQIEGEVLYPGTYTIQDRNERISDLIERAGGLTREAFIQGVRLTRSAGSIDRADIRFDFVGDDEEIDTDGIASLRVRESRIGIDLQAILDNPGSREDLLLRNGDVLRIPQELETVRIAGAVMQDVEVRYREGLKLSDYVSLAGGYAEDARKRRAYVIYANGDVDRRKRYLFGLISSTPEIEPGAEIIIPEKPQSDGMSTSEIISLSSVVVSMSTGLIIAIDRLSR